MEVRCRDGKEYGQVVFLAGGLVAGLALQRLRCSRNANVVLPQREHRLGFCSLAVVEVAR